MKPFNLISMMMALILLMSVMPARCEEIILKTGVKITNAVKVKAGTYQLADGGSGMVQISGSGYTVDFTGAKIRGDGKGIRIHLTDARNVTIKNADVSRCKWGIMLERCEGVKLIGCISSRNANLPPGTVIDESGREPEDQHGGGIFLRDCKKCIVDRCIAQHQWDGIDVVRSSDNVVQDGDYSFNGNWGVHLWNSSRNSFKRNRAIWCTTGGGKLYQALTGWQTYDAQAVGIDHNSCENLIEGNDLRFGGDAIFIRANEGPITPGTVVPPLNGSHRNILRNNDCSFSPNNAIEVDLVDDTVIEGNNCSNSNYGMWLGYSRRCIVRNNICVNDSNHAVEIENGQDDTFEGNVFGFDNARPDAALVYLRQNGRDKTPSGPYKFKRNTFYGAGTGLQLKDTSAELVDNILFSSPADKPNTMVSGNSSSHYSHTDDHIRTVLVSGNSGQITILSPVKPGSIAKITIKGAIPISPATVIEIDGIPVQIISRQGKVISFQVPADSWVSPARSKVSIRILTDAGWASEDNIPVAWQKNIALIESITPNPASIGDTVTLEGKLLIGRVLLNDKPAIILEQTPTRVKFAVPDGILMPTQYNLLVENGDGDSVQSTWPITFGVAVQGKNMPHLISASFSPTTLKVGDLLKVTFVVKNNLPSAVPLMTLAPPPFTYEEKQASWELGIQEPKGTLHLRVSSDQPQGHESGSWPWMFGFSKSSLAPGETIEVIGYIRVSTPGDREFRTGLVVSGSRFIDDNMFRTKITVQP